MTPGSPPGPPSGNGWYITDWSRDPKAEYVFDAATGFGMWDPRSRAFDGSHGSCDLVWYPGWTLRYGWPNVGLATWPA